ncbi:hypothetical protein M0R45_004806 [Rubus argutus]|uniref:F-box domain-containing protein n=1 Tax=Rubus argutus TaxID=59490 RepID=A0AAW1YKW2_RUBAR
MASPKAMATTNEHLPEDIIVQILYRLPVKPLVRFKCVSKQWSSIVSDPQFAKSQFKFASERKTLSHKLLVSTSSQLESLDLQTPSFGDDSSLRKLTCPFKEPGRAIKIVGSCNGMVFVVARDFHNTFYIWNPSTGLLFKLPNPGFDSIVVRLYPDLPHWGFGYVSAADDYKVFVAGSFRDSTVPVEMYSSKANSWKRIESQPHFSSDEYFTDSKGTFSNEALHWLHDAEIPTIVAEKPTIIAFDLVKEKFWEMPLPLLKQDDETNAFHSQMGVVSGGCLCVASYDGDVYSCEIIQLWVMMDYGVCESWTKLVKLVDYQLQPPFVYWERSIVIFSDDTWEVLKELVRFDHKVEEKLDKVEVCSGRYKLEGDDFNMIEYDESLLWLHDYQGAEGRR